MVKFVHTTSCATLFTETFPIFAHFAILNRKLLTTLICIVMRGVLAADLTYTVPEDVSPNHLIANLARDTNLQQFVSADSLHDLRYSFLAGDPDQTRMFRLSETTSDLKTAQNTTSFDRETLCLYSEKCVLHVQVAVHSILNQFFRKISVNINVTDVNDNAPVFPTESLEVRISETISIPSSFPLVTATDLDTGPGNGLKEYELVPVDGPFGLHYSVGNPNLILVVERAGIDHEKQKSYQVKVLARDGGNPVNTGTLSVNILIEDKNDNEPHFSEQTYEVTVDEHAARGERLIAVKATDVDSGQNGMLRYKLSDQQSVDVLNMFKIDLLSGELSIIGDLENGKREKYKIIVEATDMGSPPFTTTTAVTVRVRDTINSLPKITISFLVGGNGYSRISEYASVGAVVVHVAVVDADRGRNGIIQCHIEQRQYYKLQSLDVNEYKVIVARTLDRETIAIHNVTVLCSDAGIKPLTASSTFEVRVLDENDNSPRFAEQSYRVFLPENRLAGHELLRVTASDEDSGENGKVRYSLHRNARGRFVISASTGEIVTNDEFDFELQTSFNFTVIAIDGGIPALTGSTEIVVIIIDVNDQRPSFARDIFSFTVSEFARLGKVVGRVTANDFESGPNGQLDIFADRNANVGPFAVQSNGSITLNGLLDHELTKYYYFRVIARDHGRSPLSDTAEVQITVLDENDNRPIVTNPNGTELIIRVSMDNDVAVPVAVMKATDKDSGLNGQVQYVITSRNDSGRFDVDSKSGEMFITRTLSHRDVTIYRIQVLVQDSGTPPLSASRPITLWIHAGNSTRYAGNPGPTDTYFFLILVIICVTIILCAITVLIIVAMRRMDDRRKRHRPGSSAMHVQNSHALTSRTDNSKADNLRNQCLSDRLEEKEYGQRNFQTFGKGRYDEEEFGFSPFSKVDHAKQYGNVYSEATHHIPYSSEVKL